MTIKQAKKEIKKAGGDWKVFMKWMSGQTCGLDSNGETDLYDYDVQRFIKYKCDPKKEPLRDFD